MPQEGAAPSLVLPTSEEALGAQASAGGSQKRPAELAGQELEEQGPSAKSPRLENLPGSLPGTADGMEGAVVEPVAAGQEVPSLAQQLVASQADATRWREECEGVRRQLELAQKKVRQPAAGRICRLQGRGGGVWGLR